MSKVVPFPLILAIFLPSVQDLSDELKEEDSDEKKEAKTEEAGRTSRTRVAVDRGSESSEGDASDSSEVRTSSRFAAWSEERFQELRPLLPTSTPERKKREEEPPPPPRRPPPALTTAAYQEQRRVQKSKTLRFEAPPQKSDNYTTAASSQSLKSILKPSPRASSPRRASSPARRSPIIPAASNVAASASDPDLFQVGRQPPFSEEDDASSEASAASFTTAVSALPSKPKRPLLRDDQASEPPLPPPEVCDAGVRDSRGGQVLLREAQNLLHVACSPSVRCNTRLKSLRRLAELKVEEEPAEAERIFLMPSAANAPSLPKLTKGTLYVREEFVYIGIYKIFQFVFHFLPFQTCFLSFRPRPTRRR